MLTERDQGTNNVKTNLNFKTPKAGGNAEKAKINEDSQFQRCPWHALRGFSCMYKRTCADNEGAKNHDLCKNLKISKNSKNLPKIMLIPMC